MHGLTFIESERHVVFRLELANDLQSCQKIRLNPLGRIRQIKEQLLPLAGLHRLVFGQELFPDGRHVRQHRPVHHSDEGRRRPELLNRLVAETGKNGFPIGILHRGQLAKHDFAIVEFKGRGQGRLGKGVNLRAFCKFCKNRMEFRIAAHPHVFHRGSEGRHRKGHERAVPADLFHGRHDLEICALPRRLTYFFREGLDRGVGKIFRGGLALIHHLKNGI